MGIVIGKGRHNLSKSRNEFLASLGAFAAITKSITTASGGVGVTIETFTVSQE
jgi:hypothetical protein